jgi:hypothetical protein
MVGEGTIRRIITKPRYRSVRIDPGHINEFVRIDDLETPIMKFQDALLAQIAKHPIYVHAGEPGCVANILLRQREMHFLTTMAWPAHA